jgi:UDP-galactopyranose mutase
MADLSGTPDGFFRSFWIAGFESACHINRAGLRLDMLATTQHDKQAAHDYELLHSIGIFTARDGIRWHLIDNAGRYDFSSLAPMVKAADQHGIQVIWSLCHYGWPKDVDVWSKAFVQRFADYCGATARFITEHSGTRHIYSPINEISYLAWMAGDQGRMHPFGRGRGAELKRQLVRAAIAGCDAIWSVEPRARIVHVDPLIHIVPPLRRQDLAAQAAARREGQFESWDMLAGRMAPELGGHPRYLQTIGVNFYYNNQWVHPSDRRLRWEDTPREPRWVPLHQLLAEVYERYRSAIFISETSHYGSDRGRWLNDVASEVCVARSMDIPVEGICVYPILDRPDWDNLNHWHNSGLWDLQLDQQGQLQRVLDQQYAADLRRAQQQLKELGYH